ncbi:MAG TPA: hypothetical protein VFS02_24625 [Telluria sp.]|nr:hypothetical protein [Telluria sp.]
MRFTGGAATVMNRTSRILKKSYAMQRMADAIDRAVRAAGAKEKERAARWVAAWGMLCGIRSESIRLRRSEVADSADERVRLPSDEIEIPPELAPPGLSKQQARPDCRAAEAAAIADSAGTLVDRDSAA